MFRRSGRPSPSRAAAARSNRHHEVARKLLPFVTTAYVLARRLAVVARNVALGGLDLAKSREDLTNAAETYDAPLG